MIEWNTVKYIDCMDEKEGLPSLPDKSIDLCLTDPPYNINFKGLSHKTMSLNRKLRLTPYPDKIKNYNGFSVKWFTEIKRICNGIIFTCGYRNLRMWYNIDDFELMVWINMLRQGSCKISFLNKVCPILCYGKFNNKMKLNVFKYNFGGDNIFDIKTIHPTPRAYKLIEWIVSNIKPKSVIDPFLGSGTTAEACTKLSIPWIGYEINEIYSQDINKRLNRINLTKSGLNHWFK